MNQSRLRRINSLLPICVLVSTFISTLQQQTYGFAEGVSGIKEVLQAIYCKEDVDNWWCRQWYTFRSLSMCCQLSRWNCMVRQCHADHVSIRAPSGSTLRFPSCPIIVGPLFPNSQLSVAVIRHTLCYSMIQKSLFAKTDDSPNQILSVVEMPSSFSEEV